VITSRWVVCNCTITSSLDGHTYYPFCLCTKVRSISLFPAFSTLANQAHRLHSPCVQAAKNSIAVAPNSSVVSCQKHSGLCSEKMSREMCCYQIYMIRLKSNLVVWGSLLTIQDAMEPILLLRSQILIGMRGAGKSTLAEATQASSAPPCTAEINLRKGVHLACVYIFDCPHKLIAFHALKSECMHNLANRTSC